MCPLIFFPFCSFLAHCNKFGIYVQPGDGESHYGVQVGLTFEVSVTAVMKALSSTGIEASDITVLKVGPCGDLPTKEIPADLGGDALARLGRALNFEQIDDLPVIASLRRILGHVVNDSQCLLVDLDLK
jgi:hypothetical protein